MAIENIEVLLTANADKAVANVRKFASALSEIKWPANQGASATQNLGNEMVKATPKIQNVAKSAKAAGSAVKSAGKDMENAGDSAKRGSSGLEKFFSVVKRIVLRRAIISVMRSISSAFKEGETNLYNYSKTVNGDFAASMDRLATSTQYLKNSLGTLVAPLMEALEPTLNTIIDWLVEAINYFNMFVAALSGKSTYTAAVRQSTSWANGMSDALANANEEAQNLKRTILGFDEINKLTDVSSGSGGSGGSGSSGGGAGMFEERQLSGGFQEFSSAFESAISDTLSRITMIVGAAELALGAILALSGANVGLGLALMASGAVTIASAIIANWDSISPEIKLAIAGVETALGTMLAVGAVIAFSGGNVGLGIGLMIGALSLGGGAATLAWNTIKDKMKSPVEAVGALIAGIMFGIGAVIAFSGHPGVGIGIMIAATAAGEATINWDYLQEKLQGPIGTITALVSGAELVLGILMIIAGHPGIGLGLIVSGLGTGLLDIAANWDEIKTWFSEMWGKFKSSAEETWEDLKEIGSGIWGKIKEGISSAVSSVGSWIKEHIFKPFISAWNWLFGKSDSNVSNAVVSNADVDASQAEELRKLGREMGKYIKDGLSSKMKNAGNDAWDAVVNGWNGVKDKTLNAELTFTSSDDAWTTFKAGWDTQSHILEFGATWSSDSPDGELYSTFIQGWNSAGSKSLYFSPKLDNQAQVLYNGFKTDWDNLPSKSLYFSPKLDNQAQVLYNGFKKDWDDMGSTSLYFSPKLDNQAQVLYNGFKKDWNDLPSNSLYFSPKLDNTAKVLFDGFRRDWNALDSNSLYFSPKLDNTAKVLFDGFKKAWEEASSPLKVDVEVNWDGSGSGSGGGTSGGGNGRYTMPVTLETPTQTDVQTYWDALKKHWDNLSRLGIAVLGLKFSGVDAEGVATIWDILKQSWDSGVVATGKYLEMVVQPISTAGQTLAEGASNFWYWLFGNDITTQGPTLDLEFEANAVLSPEVQLDQWQHKMDEWADELGIEVPVTATVATKASTLAYNFQQSWIKLTSGSKTVSFINQLRNAASGLAYAFQQSWIKLGNPNKQVSFINQLKSGASTLAYNFQQAWIGLTDNSKKVSFINQLKVAASSLAYGFQQGWIKLGDGAKQVSFLNVLRSGASALAYGFQQNWIGLTDDSKKVSFLNQLRNAAGGLAYGFLQNWIGLDDSKKQISFLNKLNTGAGTAAAGFLDKWGQLDDEKKSVSLINNLTRSGSNWSGKKGAQKWWEAQPGTSGVSLLTNLTNSGSNWAEGLLKFLTGNKDGIVSIALNIGGTIWDKVKSALGWLGVPGFANGGIINAFGFSDFANGGILGHGTLFRAGENGAEVVGHIGGRTEVLNRSQLASTMYYSVRSAMAPLYTYGNSDESMVALAEYIGNAIDSAMAKDRELMRQQNEYLRQINDKEFSAEITTSSINQAQTRMNRRAGTTIVPVGT